MSQIIFFEKNKCDFERENNTATSSESPLLAPNILNRINESLWITTDSLDANNTTVTIDFSDASTFTNLLLTNHNFKDFTIQYFDIDLASFQDFSTAINESSVAVQFSRFQFDAATTSQIKITITATQVADAEKQLGQFIATNVIGQFVSYPEIINPEFGRDFKTNEMLSGKLSVYERQGRFSMGLRWAELGATFDDDLELIENLYNKVEGFLAWPSGGDENQFSSIRKGYRLEDIFLMRTTNRLEPEWSNGVYSSYGSFVMTLDEVIT